MIAGNAIRAYFLSGKEKTVDTVSMTLIEDNHRGPLSISRGILVSVVLGLAMWTGIFAIIHAMNHHLL